MMESIRNPAYLSMLNRKERLLEEIRAINKSLNRYNVAKQKMDISYGERSMIINQWKLGKSIPNIALLFERPVYEIFFVIEEFTVSPYIIKSSIINTKQEK